VKSSGNESKPRGDVSIYLHYLETVNIIWSAAQSTNTNPNLFNAVKTTWHELKRI